MSDVKPRIIGGTHILFKDRDHKHIKVYPLNTVIIKQGAHGCDNEYHICGVYVSLQTFNAVIRLIEGLT